MIVGEPSLLPAAELQQTPAHQFGEQFARHVGIGKGLAGGLKDILASEINPLIGLLIAAGSKRLRLESRLDRHFPLFMPRRRRRGRMPVVGLLIMATYVIANELDQFVFL